MKLKLGPHSEIQNNKEDGLYLLRNDNLLMQIRYYEVKNKDGETIMPGITITVVNEKYTANTFDELETVFKEEFLKDKRKEDS